MTDNNQDIHISATFLLINICNYPKFKLIWPLLLIPIKARLRLVKSPPIKYAHLLTIP